jgi:hypothetical protein
MEKRQGRKKSRIIGKKQGDRMTEYKEEEAGRRSQEIKKKKATYIYSFRLRLAALHVQLCMLI